MRHTQLHGLYISLAQALLGQNAYASSAHSCQMGIKRGRKPAEGELEDLSRTTSSFKQAEVDRVQACRRQAQVDDADSGSAGNSDLSAEEEEDDTYKTRQQTLSFFDERYEYAACSFPAQHEQFRAEASHILRVHNEKLLRSFCCFATQYIAASCPKDADDFTELRETAKTLPICWRRECRIRFFRTWTRFGGIAASTCTESTKSWKRAGAERAEAEPVVFPRLRIQVPEQPLVFHRCLAAPRVVRGGPQHLRGGPDDRDSQPRCRRRRRCIQAGCWFQKIGAVNVRKSRWTPQNIRQVHGQSFVDHAVTARGRFFGADFLSAGAAAHFASVCSPVGSAGL